MSLYTCNITDINDDSIKAVSYDIAGDLYYASAGTSVELVQETEFSDGVRFSVSPPLPSVLTLNTNNGNISVTSKDSKDFSEPSEYTVKGILSDGTELKKTLRLGVLTNEIWLKDEGGKYSAYVVGDGNMQSVTWGSSDTNKVKVTSGEVNFLAKGKFNVVVYATTRSTSTRDSYSNWVKLSAEVTEVDKRFSVVEGAEVKKLIINSGVTYITNNEFQGRSITSVTIPSSVTSIGSGAFNGNSLTRVDIPNSVTNIGVRAFYLNKLKSVKLPDNLTNINKETFLFNMITNINIPSSVTSIGNGAFNMNRLIRVEIPDSVTNIGNGAFNGNRLTRVEIPDSVRTIGFDAFSGNNLESVKLSENLTSIDSRAFSGNQLTNINIPNSVKSIGNGAFDNNSKLVEVSLTNKLYNSWSDDAARGKTFGDQVKYFLR